VETDFQKQADMEKMDIAEFNIMLTTGPLFWQSRWQQPNLLQAYAEDQAKKFDPMQDEVFCHGSASSNRSAG
jgi:hypothetical protein